ncbi:MAG: tRNA adenosine(34) deaminase TadA [Victivallales bacterium]|nr:tRNA adenosine(34) deaminase TadA [Victivallales bacterium]
MQIDDEQYMRFALEEAQLAFQEGEVPVGAVIVRNGEIVARAHNKVEALKQGTAHAELLALQEASEKLGAWRLDDCTMYVTKEPCPQCAGAMVNCRLARLVYGCGDPVFGAAGSKLDVLAIPGYLHNVQCTPGILADECLRLIKDFFRQRRASQK